MTTTYAACLARLGLSQPEAAALHGVRIDTVKSWAQGRNRPPAAVFNELRAYEARIREISGHMQEEWSAAKDAHGAPDRIDLDLSGADRLAAMAAANFVLGLAGVSVADGRTEATIAARNARRLAE